MVAERRKHPRLAKFIEATWSGASGGAGCRISDISWGGCFIQSHAEPQIGEETAITFSVEGTTINLVGTVRCVDRPLGFAIQFGELTDVQIEALKTILGPGGPS